MAIAQHRPSRGRGLPRRAIAPENGGCVPARLWRGGTGFALLLVLALALAAPAEASFGFLPGKEGFNLSIKEADGTLAMQAGSHPFEVSSEMNFAEQGRADGGIQDVHIVLPPGLFANPRAVAQCSVTELTDEEGCPDNTAIGSIEMTSDLGALQLPLFNIAPPGGIPAEFGGAIGGMPILLSGGLRADGSLELRSLGISHAATIAGLRIQLWGVPYDKAHDAERGSCLEDGGSCPAAAGPGKPFLTLPTSCSEPFRATIVMDSSFHRGRNLLNGEPDLSDPAWVTATAEPEGQGAPAHVTGCGRLAFQPQISLQASEEAASATGLNAAVMVADEGINLPRGLIASPIKRLVLEMPDGFSINPSVANGLGACSQAEYEVERFSSKRQEGCPDSSNVGSVKFGSPILGEREIEGAVYVAKQSQNPLNSSLALYVIARDAKSGLFFKMAAAVDLDNQTGQVTISLDELPQLPLRELTVSFWNGPRAALASPRVCGSYTATAQMFSWARPESALEASMPLRISAGPNGAPCPTSASARAFDPEVVAGITNINAGRYTSFVMRITRTDAEPTISSFSTQLPPGLLANLTGLGRCSDSAINFVRGMTAADAAASAVCPSSSMIGATQVGAGVGLILSYVSGNVYLAGPYKGSPFSVVAVTPAQVGPFDLGTIVLRFPLHVDLETGQISLESDPAAAIPQIMDGIPTRIRDIRLYLNREKFLVNPTSCEPFSIITSLSSEGVSAVNSEDFQVANCLNLPLAPQMSLKLSRGSGHGAHPAFTASIRSGLGKVNIAAARITLPPSEQLDPSHLRRLCPTDLVVEGGCPEGSQYGTAKVFSPLLEAPLEGPIYLVNSRRRLPNVVANLKGDSLAVMLRGSVGVSRGRLRIAFGSFPDVPVSRFELQMPGGQRGILVNNTNLCRDQPVARARIHGQNGRIIGRQLSAHVACRGSGRPTG